MELNIIEGKLEDKTTYKLFIINKSEDNTINVTTPLDKLVLLETQIKQLSAKKLVTTGTIGGYSQPIITKKYIITNELKELKTEKKSLIRSYTLDDYKLKVQFIFDNTTKDCQTYIVILFEKKNIKDVIKFIKKYHL